MNTHPHLAPVPVNTRSRLARLQQAVVVVTLLWTVGWLVWARNASAGVMAAGVLLILWGYALVLALEFVAVAWVNRGDSVPRARVANLAAAWWQEVRIAPQVFSWCQPFRWRSLPDHAVPAAPGRTAAVLVYGFVCNRGFWLPWMRALLQRNIPYTSVNLEPVFGSIDAGVQLIDDAVRRAHALTSCAPVLVCHSMGGLAARAWRVATPDADTRCGPS